MVRLKHVFVVFCTFCAIYIYLIAVSRPCLQYSPHKEKSIVDNGEKPLRKTTDPEVAQQSTSSTILSYGNTTRFRLHYRMNSPSICSSIENLTFIVVVHTAIGNFNKRLGIRQTWANANHYKNFTMRAVFFVGRPEDNRLQGLLQEENRQFKDIVQGDFLDTYRNITYKGVMVYHWISEFCMHAQVILKVDDDVFVNMFRIVQQHLPVLRKHPRQIFCDVVKHGRVRQDLKNKWGLKPNEIPANRKEYPTYCRGYIVLMTSDLIVPMIERISSNPFFWIDDVYLYGLLPEQLGVRWHNIAPRIPQVFKYCLQSYKREKQRTYKPSDACLNVPGRREMVYIWEMVLGNLPESDLVLLTNHTFLSWIQQTNKVIQAPTEE